MAIIKGDITFCNFFCSVCGTELNEAVEQDSIIQCDHCEQKYRVTLQLVKGVTKRRTYGIFSLAPLKSVGISFTKRLVKELDDLVKLGVFSTRSEAVCSAVRDMLLRMKRFKEQEGG
jgi:DNA-directed RNA polymerase subunit RPC12/RpoP